MEALTAFGLATVTAMLVFYALEDRSPWFILAFAGACALGSIYGFLQGAWPSASSRQSGPASRYGGGFSGPAHDPIRQCPPELSHKGRANR